MIEARKHIQRIRDRLDTLAKLNNKQLGTIEGGLDRVAYDLGEAISYVLSVPHPDEPEEDE